MKKKLTLLTGLSVLTLVMLGTAGIAAASGTPAAVKHQPQAAPGSSAVTSASAVARTPSGSPATYPSVSGRFYHVAAASDKDVWAVGLQGGAIWHWNGGSWVSYSDGFGGFQGVSAQSPTDAWAVGFTNPNGCYCGTAAFHWNGKRWSVAPTPNPSAGFLDALLGVGNHLAVRCLGRGLNRLVKHHHRALERQVLANLATSAPSRTRAGRPRDSPDLRLAVRSLSGEQPRHRLRAATSAVPGTSAERSAAARI